MDCLLSVRSLPGHVLDALENLFGRLSPGQNMKFETPMPQDCSAEQDIQRHQQIDVIARENHGFESAYCLEADGCSSELAQQNRRSKIEDEHFSKERQVRSGLSDRTSTSGPPIVHHPTTGAADMKGDSWSTQRGTEQNQRANPGTRPISMNRRKKRAPTPPPVTGPKDGYKDGRCDAFAQSTSDGSFMDRLPAAMVDKVASTVITRGPHKLAPISADGPPPPGSVAPSERALAATEGALNGRPDTPPDTEPDDAAASDVDSGTADVMDDLPSPVTPEPEELASDRVTAEDRHRVVISVTQNSSEIHGPLGCQEVPPVVVLLKLGNQGRYGFNVKGGADTNMPVTVSKVAPRSAIRCDGARLSEGDQVLLINGKDIATYTHREVVRYIKACREKQSELELTVKPNLNCEGHDDLEEPPVRFVPDTTPLTLSAPESCAATLTLTADATPLARSIAELAHALSRGMAQLEFDGLARRELSLTMDDCRLPSNISKNRYRDISPYDCSRVVLRTAESGDYINANFVNMEIPGSGVTNRYIAAQGPLHHTTDDFWAMIWEQKCTLVVMLTTLVEQGRVKCHQYWPDQGESLLFGDFQVTTVSEELTESFAFRDITIMSQETGEERHLSHMQYVSWPDHGVPEQAADFVQFVQRVRAARAGLVEPTVVHCSAGIGRTGVLILMETAMCLIEANQPVYPLELVRAMRRQRAMMIQTPSQFEFVCEAVVQAHREGTVRPLAELGGRD